MIAREENNFQGKEKQDKKLGTNVTKDNLLLTPTQINLLEMAKYSDISATSFTLTLESQSKPNCLFVEDWELQEQSELENKAFCAIFINKKRVISCIDSGSDLTIMQIGLLERIFQGLEKNLVEPSRVKNITSFSQNSIKVLGQLNCQVAFSKNGPLVEINITIVCNIPGVPTFLFGMDSMRRTKAVLSFDGGTNARPKMLVRNPIKQQAQIYDSAPRQLHICTAEVQLNPYETTATEFFLNPAAPVIRTDIILITSICWDTISIFPSKSELEFDEKYDCFVARAQIANLSSKPICKSIKARFEILSDSFSAIPITRKNKRKIKKLMKENSTEKF